MITKQKENMDLFFYNDKNEQHLALPLTLTNISGGFCLLLSGLTASFVVFFEEFLQIFKLVTKWFYKFLVRSKNIGTYTYNN